MSSLKKSVMLVFFSLTCMFVLVTATSKADASSGGNLAYNPNAVTEPGYPQPSASFTCGCDSAWSVVNGIYSFTDISHDRWTNYTSPNSTDWLAITFGSAASFNQVNLYLYNDGGGVQLPASYAVEYWNGTEWTAVSNPQYSPATPSAPLNTVANSSPNEALNTVAFDTVTSDKVRVVFTNGAAKVGVVEMQVIQAAGGVVVSFESNGGTAVSSQTVSYDTAAARPDDPTRDGYTFAGWYSDASFTDAFDFSTPIQADTALFAKWTQSANADLNGLTLSNGSFSPLFDPATLSYTISVVNSVSSLSVTPTTVDSTATVQVRINDGLYATAASGSESSPLNLTEGINTVDVKVTAQDGTSKTYSVTVKRAEAPIWTYCSDERGNCIFQGTSEVRYGVLGAYVYRYFTDGTICENETFQVDPAPGVQKTCYVASISLSGLTVSNGVLTPSFDPEETNYELLAANSVDRVKVTPTISDVTATLTVNNMPVESGQESDEISLNVGSTPITVVATGLDGKQRTYTITAKRAPASSNADLSGLESSIGTLSPAFAPDKEAYTVTVGNDVGRLDVTGIAPDSSTVTVVDTTYGTDRPIAYTAIEIGDGNTAVSFPVTIHENGASTIRIDVLAEDQMTTRSYSILFRSDLIVADVRADESGSTIQLTFNQPLSPESVGADAFAVHIGGDPVTVSQAVYSTDRKTVYVTLQEPMYKWDRITLDVQEGVIQSVYGLQLAGLSSVHVRNESAAYSPDFSDPGAIHLNHIIAYLSRRHSDVDVNGDGHSDEADIRLALSHIQPVGAQ